MNNELIQYLKDREHFYKSMAYKDSHLSDFYIGKSDGIRSVLIHLEKEHSNGSYK